jgi:hypothetical protein
MTAREAYLALVEFLRLELKLCCDTPTIDLRGLIAEMEPEASGSSADPGGVEQFVDAVLRVKEAGGDSAWPAKR